MEYISIIPSGATYLCDVLVALIMADLDLTREYRYLRLPHPRTGGFGVDAAA